MSGLRMHISGPPDSYLSTALAELEVIDTHLHSHRRYMCTAVTPNGEVHVADPIGSVVSPNTATGFTVTSGNNNWGSWVQILGSSDTPVTVGMAFADINEFYMVDASHAQTVYVLQMAYGASGAAALAAGAYSEFIHSTGQTVQASDGPQIFGNVRVASGTKRWMRVLTPGFNARTLTFFFGLHEYAV